MKNRIAKILAVAALALGAGTMAAQAANCEGRRDTGTAVGAVGGGVIGNAASGSVGGTIAGAVVGGVAGNLIGGSGCSEHRTHYAAARRHYDSHGHAFYYDRAGHKHYYKS